ncbi:MAG: hypothetical protein HW411_43 [Gammaproteobacteria bacterium]|nr:hypothetical protein [Gammaproteobacteria bacterium]
MLSRLCKPYLLASSGSCEFWICTDCRTITMNLGSITLRLQEEHFKNIADTMQIAIHQFMHYKTSHTPCPEFAASNEQHKPN